MTDMNALHMLDHVSQLTFDWFLAFCRAVLYYSASSNALFNLQEPIHVQKWKWKSQA